jgi:periplasmic protein TonB
MTLQKILIVIVVLALAAGLALAGVSGPAQAKQENKDKDLTKPVVINQINPTYPEEAKKEKVQGEVILTAVISAEGKVVDVTVKKSVDERLSKAAMDAVRQWTFQPGKDAKGKAVQVKSDITVNFKLK